MKNIAFWLLLAIILGGCAPKSNNQFFDTKSLSQNPSDYAKNHSVYEFDASLLEQKIFEVWDKNISAKEIDSSFAFKMLAKDGYKENLQAYTDTEKELLRQKMRECKPIDYKAIASRNSDIRVVPSKKPYFFDPKKAGEGYPFDNFQESAIYINTPLRALCETTDGQFIYVANFISDGWMDSRDMLFLDENSTSNLKKMKPVAITKDKLKLTSADVRFIESANIGSFVFINTDKLYSATPSGVVILGNKSDEFADIPSKFSPQKFATLAQNLMNEPYGWGGYLQNRDCSSFLRDLFLPFGVYLPRNSYDQAHFADFVDLSSLSTQGKIAKIKAECVPFRTLLYLKGHIMLFVGVAGDEVIALHDSWGFAYLENGLEKRYIIGKPIISTLFVGIEHAGFDTSKSLANRILGMRVIR